MVTANSLRRALVHADVLAFGSHQLFLAHLSGNNEKARPYVAQQRVRAAWFVLDQHARKITSRELD